MRPAFSCHKLPAVLSFLLLLISLLGIVTTTGAAEAPIRDTWQVAEQDGNAVGLSRTRVWPTVDGYHYLVDVTLQIDFGGSGPIRVTQQYDVNTDKDAVLRSFQMVTQVNDSRTTQLGENCATGLHVATTGADGKTNRSSWKFDEPIYFEDALFGKIAVENATKAKNLVTARIWDFSKAIVKQATYTVQKGTIDYQSNIIQGFALNDSNGTQTFVDLNGTIYRQEVPQEKIVARFVTEDEIPTLKSLSVDTLTVPGNIVVDRPYSSLTSQIRVTWHGVAQWAFDWEDNRQKLAAYDAPTIAQTTEPTAEQSVLLHIRRDERDFTGKLALPVHSDAFGPYLHDVDFITPSSPAIHKVAGEILAGETDGWAATQKLVQWVFNYIQPAMIPETLTAEQILEKKMGKCAEYAVLFASLARAAGLPTRIVLGERFESNNWIGHMWNEVWLGEWVAVDASHNQVAPDALLLKFVHSEGVMGTQQVRWGLVGRLGINIENVALPTDDSTGVQTGVLGRTYTNISFDCQVIAPKEWLVTETQEQGLPMIVMSPPSSTNIQAIMLMFSIPQGTRADQLMAVRIPALQGALPAFQLLETANQTLGTGNLTAATATWLIGAQDARFQQSNWISIDGDAAYLFVFSAPIEDWSSAEVLFKQIRDSFQRLH